MAIQLPLTVREWGDKDDKWPDRRITLTSSNEYALMISPKMANIEVARKEAEFLASSVNEYADVLPILERLKDKAKDIADTQGIQDKELSELIEQAENALKKTAFDY